MTVLPVRAFGLACSLLCLCVCAAPAGEAGRRPAGPPPAAQDLLARLLAQAEAEPLAVLAATDPKSLPEALATSVLGKALADPQYLEGRTELLRLVENAAGADVGALWAGLRPHFAGPAALVLTTAPAAKPGGPPRLRVALLFTVRDAQAAEAARLAWNAAKPEPDGLLAEAELRPCPADQLAAGTPPAWAAGLAGRKGTLFLMARPRALRAALAAGDAADNAVPAWLSAVLAFCQPEFERLELETQITNGECVERLRARLAPDAAGPFSRLLKTLKARPASWDSLQAALPGAQDVVLLAQADLSALGGDLPLALHLLEGLLRGEKWARAAWGDPVARAPERFGFLTAYFTGTFAVVGCPSLSGEAQAVGLAATPGQDVPAVRAALLEGLAGLGAQFRTQEQAPRIGGHAPLAAAFKGRGFIPAPVIGMSEGWLWLCSNTAAYQELVASFAPGGQTLGAELKAAGGAEPGAAFFGPAPRPALRLRVNMAKVSPLLYTSWMLGEGGPRLFGWKVPGPLLASPGFLKRHVSPYDASLAWDNGEVVIHARGPVPGGAYAPLGMMDAVAEALTELQRRRPETVRRQLQALQGKASAPSPDGAHP